MALINENYLNLPEDYLFKEIARKLNIFHTMRPKADTVHLDSGDSRSIALGEVPDALHAAIDEMSDMGEGKQLHTAELSKSIIARILKVDYETRGVRLTPEEVFLSNNAMGIASDVCDLFSTDNILAFLDPSYPAFIYTAVMAGRAGFRKSDGRWNNFVYVPCNNENHYAPEPPKEHADVIYLNLPHNPTGTTFSTDLLKKWVKYATVNQALIIYDASHAHYISDKDTPHSIFEIKGAKKVAIEIRSLSKMTGYSATNFAFVVIPKDVVAYSLEGATSSLNSIWQRKRISSFSGLPYITLKSAEALYSDEGLIERKKLVAYYMENASIIRNTLTDLGFKVTGGVNSPYVWLQLHNGTSSWNFFERMLYEANVVCSPGVGFCPGGEGYVRFTSFSSREKTEEAMRRIRSWQRTNI